MYRVLCDDVPIFDPRDEDLVLIDAVVEPALNQSGSFEFKIPPMHPQYDLPVKMLSTIQVYQDEDEIFNGRIVEDTVDFYNRRVCYCEGQLAYLNDSIQRPAEYHDMTVRGYLETLIANHNAQMTDTRKQFTVGIVTVTDNNDSLYRYTNYQNTLTEIKEDLIDDLGGYIRVRNANGIHYIDYLAELTDVNSQVVDFGENLIDISRNVDLRDLCTAIIPLGASLEERTIEALDERVNITSVNDGKDYIVNDELVAKYGLIIKTVKWDDVTTPEMLLSKAQKYLSSGQFDSMVIEAKAVDMHLSDSEIESFKVGDSIHVYSPLHGIDTYFPLTSLKIYLTKPSSNTITLNGSAKVTATSKASQQSSDIVKVSDTVPVQSYILQQAISQATALITSATHGYVTITDDASELLIADNANYKQAAKIWRWNLNGLGYSNTGYNGTYATAITMDGQIVGDRLVGNSVSAEKIDITYRNTVESEIAAAEQNALYDSEYYTDTKLTQYYTKSEVTTAIQNTRDAVLLSAQETAVQYVDGKLKSYSTSAQIKVTTDAITTEVNKKLNTSDLSTQIQQSASSVQIAWNNISKYIEFASGELRIYDTAVESTHKIVSKFNYSGEHFYRDGTYIGKIGTNAFTSYPEYRGLTFDIEYNTGYMSWARKTSSDASAYTVKFVWYKDDTISKAGFNFWDPVYFHGNLYLTDSYRILQYSDGSVKYEGGFNFGGAVYCGSTDDKVLKVFGGTTFTCYNNVTIDFYSALDMHGYSINNQSDARMKKNIAATNVNALDVLNGFDLVQFDWVQDNEHEDIGIIAQQLQMVAPDLVTTAEDGHLSIKTTKFIFYLIKAVQELSAGQNWNKAEWSDPYTLLEKKTFCAHLKNGAEKEPVKTEKRDAPPVLPDRARRR